MKYLKLFEDRWEYTPEKLSEFVDKYGALLQESNAYVENKANIIMATSALDVSQDTQSYKNMIDKLESYSASLKAEVENINKIIDMFSNIPDERTEGTHDLVSKLEHDIASKLDWNSLEIDELISYLEDIIEYVTKTSHHDIISKVLKIKAD